MTDVQSGGRGTETAGDGSVRTAVYSAGWPALRVGRLQVIAALAGLGDLLTTYVILSSDAYIEYNPLLDALAADSVAVAMAYFVTLNAIYVGVGVLDLGWLSTGTAAFHSLVMGSATVNNLVLFGVGTSLLDVLGGAVAYKATLPLATALAFVVVVRHNERPPTAELAAVGVLLVAGMIVH